HMTHGPHYAFGFCVIDRSSLQGAVSAEEAHGVRKSQCRGTDRRIVGIRKIDSMDEIETPAIEEHVHRKPGAIDTFDSGVVLKPDPRGVALARLIGNLRFAAIDGDKVPPHGIRAGFHSAYGTIADITEHRQIEFGFTQNARA